MDRSFANESKKNSFFHDARRGVPLILITDSRYSLQHLLTVLNKVIHVLAPSNYGLWIRYHQNDKNKIHVVGELHAWCKYHGVFEVDRNRMYAVHDNHELERFMGATAKNGDVFAAGDKPFEGIEKGAHGEGLLVSPIYETPGKRSARGPKALTEVRDALQKHSIFCPIYALGGVTESRAQECFEHGATGVAAIRSIWEAAQPEKTVLKLIEPFVATS